MSCRSTHAGTLATRLARTYSGLPDKTVTRLFHSLKREAAGLPEPTTTDLEDLRFRLREMVEQAPLAASAVERSERDLLLTRDEEFDAATFHALMNIEARARQEAVLRSVKAMVADLEEPGSQAEHYTLGEDGRPAKVWYASYGSNLNRERFLTYVKGGKAEGSSTSHVGCRDKDLPEADMPIRFAGRMHFAASSGRWEGGGVAFMDNDSAGHALGRAYLINMQQFDDVVAQENGKKPGDVTVDTKKVLADGSDEVSSYALYGNMVHIGDFENAPVFTFTGKFSAHEALESASPGSKSTTSSTNQPSNNYIRMIGSGLDETFGMSVDEQADYIRGSLGMSDLTREETINILNTPWEEPKPTKYSTSSGGYRRGGLGSWDGYGTYRGGTWYGDGLDDRYGGDSYGTSDEWPPKRDYIPWWEEEAEKVAYGDGSDPTLWDDTPMALLPPKSTTKPAAPVWSWRRCVICDETTHTMHDCPKLRPGK